MIEFYQPGQHPDADQLSAFAEGALPVHEREQTLAHLAGCPDCRMIVSLALPPVEDVPQWQPVAARKPWFYGWNVAWFAGAGLAALIFLTVHIHNSATNQKRAATLTQSATVRLPEPTRAMRAPVPKMKRPGAADSLDDLKTPAATSTIDKRQTSDLPLSGRMLPQPRQLSANQQAQHQEQASMHVSIGGFIAAPRSAGAARSDQPSFGRFTGSERMDGAADQPLASQAVAAAPAGSSRPIESAPAMPAVAPQAAAGTSEAVSVNNAATQLATVDATASTHLAYPSPAAIHTLPSHLAIASTITRSNQVLALDTAGTLFLSNDGGQRWTAVAPQWPGHAVKITLASFPAPAAKTALMAGLASRADASSTGLKSKDVALGASVSGIITDATGAVIPGALVAVTDTLTGVSRTTTSDRTGHYAVGGLAPDAYRIDVTRAGFAAWRANVTLAPAQQSVQDLSLTVGAANERVTVETDGNLQAAGRGQRRKTISAMERQPPVFEITTDTGEVWVSADGKHWQRK